MSDPKAKGMQISLGQKRILKALQKEFQKINYLKVRALKTNENRKY